MLIVQTYFVRHDIPRFQCNILINKIKLYRIPYISNTQLLIPIIKYGHCAALIMPIKR